MKIEIILYATSTLLVGAFELPRFAGDSSNKSLPECLDVDMDGFAGAPADVGLCLKPKDCNENSFRGKICSCCCSNAGLCETRSWSQNKEGFTHMYGHS